MRSPLLLALAAFALAACQAPPPPSDPVAPTAPGPGTANAVAAGNVVTATPVALPAPVLELRGTSAFAAGKSSTTPLPPGTETTVEPGSSFLVELPVALPDARLSLLDGADGMVPSTGTREVGQATVLRLTPAAGLAPGARLRLRVDGASTRELHGADGRRFAPLEWPVQVAGEPVPARGSFPRPRKR
jgi:hypothetical protein